MKTCPECRTQYEDHVATCLVDGTPLDEVPSTPAVSATPAPAPVAPPPEKSGRGGIVLLALLFGAVLLIGLVAVVGLGLFGLSGSGGDTQTRVSVEEPDPSPVPTPVPVAPTPEPAAPAVIQVGFTSDPAGAEVWEGGTKLCVTPCQVEHPEIAPLPRDFVLKKAGHPDTPHSLADANIPQLVKLKRRRVVRPTPTPNPQPDPSPVAPSISLER